MALKSTEEERAILRARSAVQRFPVVEWRQRMEDFHKRSINISRGVAGPDAWRGSDGDDRLLPIMPDTDDWNPVNQADPTQPEWDARSIDSPQAHTPGSPGQWSQEMLAPGDGARLVPDTHRSLYSNDPGDGYSPRGSVAESTAGGYNTFLERVNRTVSKDQTHASDPFTDGLAPNRPFGNHSRVSSVESISSIVEEKSNSPLNKANTAVCYLKPGHV
jgi:alpha-1,3-glucan synthase